MEKNSYKICFHIAVCIIGIFGTVYLPLENKEITGWIVGSFTAFGGLLLAVMTLAGHSLTLLQNEDWEALQFFKNTYKARMLFNAFVSFLLIFTVILILGSSLFPSPCLKYISRFFSIISFLYVLRLPFYIYNIYIEYYDFIIKKQQTKK